MAMYSILTPDKTCQHTKWVFTFRQCYVSFSCVVVTAIVDCVRQYVRQADLS